MDALFDSVIANLMTEFIIVVFGVVVANQVQQRYKQWRYGGWWMRIYPGEPLPPEEPGKPVASEMVNAIEQPIFERELSAETAQRVLHDKTDFDIYVKGRISPFYDVNCDLVTELDSGKSMVISKDNAKRVITVYARAPKITSRSKSNNLR